jgi:uncharacterized protein YlxW (UPF0749 family)
LIENEDWKRRTAKLESEIGKLKNLQAQVDNYEKKVAAMNAEAERLNMVLKARLADMDQWKNRCQTLEV